MAAVTEVSRLAPGIPGLEIVRATLTGATSTFVSKFGTVIASLVKAEGTNACTWTISDRTLTITGTNADYVDIIVAGLL